jgi:hypothetical protein
VVRILLVLRFTDSLLFRFAPIDVPPHLHLFQVPRVGLS